MALEVTDPHVLLGRLLDTQRALADLVHAVEVDHAVQGIDPRNTLATHTFVALAMTKADEILKGGE